MAPDRAVLNAGTFLRENSNEIMSVIGTCCGDRAVSGARRTGSGALAYGEGERVALLDRSSADNCVDWHATKSQVT